MTAPQAIDRLESSRRLQVDRIPPGSLPHGLRATQLAASLRRRVTHACAHREDGAATLERLHQDLVQTYTAGCLILEIASLRAAQGERHEDLVREALCVLTRFERLSEAWLLLASPDPATPRARELASLLGDVFDLYATEAVVAGVDLRLASVPGPRGVNGAPVAKRLTRVIEDTMHAAGPRGRVEVESTNDGLLTWTILPCGDPATMRYLDLR